MNLLAKTKHQIRENRSALIFGISSLTIWWIAFYLIIFLKQRYFGWDLDGYHYPLEHFLFKSLGEGAIPQWDPYIYNGSDFIGNIQAAIFYPPKLLFYGGLNLFGIDLSFNLFHLFALLHVLFFSIAAYLVSFKFSKSKLISLFIALALTYNGYNQGQLQHFWYFATIAWAPLCFVSLYELIRNKSRIAFLGYVVSSSLMFLGGFPHQFLTIHATVIILVLVSILIVEKKHISGLKSLKSLIVSNLLIASLCAIQILPTIRTLLDSDTDGFTGNLNFKSLQTLLYPNTLGHLSDQLQTGFERTNSYFFTGLITFFLPFIVCIVLISKRKNLNWRFISTGLIGLALSTILVFSKLLPYIHSHIIEINFLRSSTFTLLGLFLFVVLAAYFLCEFIKLRVFPEYINLGLVLICLITFFINIPGPQNSVKGSINNVSPSIQNVGNFQETLNRNGEDYITLVDQTALASYLDNWPRIFNIRVLSGHDPIISEVYARKIEKFAKVKVVGRRVNIFEDLDWNWLRSQGVKYFITDEENTKLDLNILPNYVNRIYRNGNINIWEIIEPRPIFFSECAGIESYELKSNGVDLMIETFQDDCIIQTTISYSKFFKSPDASLSRLKQGLGFEILIEDTGTRSVQIQYENRYYTYGIFISGGTLALGLLLLFRIQLKKSKML